MPEEEIPTLTTLPELNPCPVQAVQGKAATATAIAAVDLSEMVARHAANSAILNECIARNEEAQVRHVRLMAKPEREEFERGEMEENDARSMHEYF